MAQLMLSASGLHSQSIKYHYWFDGDIMNRTIVTGSIDAIDCSGLSVGLHKINIFAEQDGEVSPSKSAWFIRDIMPDSEGNINLIVFVDGEYHSTVKAKGTGITLLDLDLLSLPEGSHTLGIQAATSEYVNAQLWETQFEASGISDSGDITMVLQDAYGNDYTDRVSIEWYCGGELIASGSQLTGIPIGETLQYRVILSEELGLSYRDILKEYIATSGHNLIEEQLIPFEPVKIKGIVNNAELPVEGVKVDIVQYPNDRFTTNTSVETASDGSFEIELIEVPTRFSFSREGYIPTYSVIESLPAQDESQLTFEILREGNDCIELKINYFAASTNGPVKRPENITDTDVNYTLLLDGDEFITGIYNGSYISLPETIEDGTTITMKLENPKKIFRSVDSSIIYSKSSATVMEITVVEQGGIECRFNGGDVPANTMGYLYNAEGRLVKGIAYRDGMTFDGLEKGNYSVVIIVNDGSLGSPALISDYEMLGLKVDNDYLLYPVEVEDGHIAMISLDGIPQPDMNGVTSITSKSLFNASKTSLTASEMLTATINLNLDEDVMANAAYGLLTISLPANCIYENGSMMINGKIAPASTNDGQVMVRVNGEDLASRIRFCLSSSEGGDYNVGATLTLNIGGEIVCPIEPLHYHVSEYDLYVPAKTSHPTIYVSGVCSANGNIKIYDGDIEVGSAIADATGQWNAQIELDNPSNNSTHRIWTLSTDQMGKSFAGQHRVCTYNDQFVIPERVTMINTAHKGPAMPVEIKTIFNLTGERSVSNKCYLYWPLYPEFTFLIDFDRNDPEQIHSVLLNVFTEHDNSVTLHADFDPSKQQWICSYKFPENDLPVNVSVDYCEEFAEETDYNYTLEFDIFSSIEEAKKDRTEIDSLINELSNASESGDDYAFDVAWAKIKRTLDLEKELHYAIIEPYEFINKCSQLSEDEIIKEFDALFPPINNEVEIPGMAEIEKFINGIDLSSGVIEEAISSGIKYALIPPVDNQGQVSYPRSITIDNIEQLKNGQTNTAILRCDNGYQITVDVSEAKQTVTSAVDGSDDNQLCTFLDRLASFLDHIVDDRLDAGTSILGTCDAAIEYAHNYEIRYAERIELMNDLYNMTKNSDDIALKCLSMVAKTARNETFIEYDPLAKQMSAIKYVKDVEGKFEVRKRVQILGGIVKAYDWTSTIQEIVDLWSSACKDLKQWDNLIELAELKCSPDIRDQFLADIHTYHNWHRTELFVEALIPHCIFSIASVLERKNPNVVLNFCATMGCSVLSGVFNNIYHRINGHYEKIRTDLQYKMFSHDECENDPRKNRPPYPPYPRNGSDPIRDPSGIVFEGGLDMPIEGVSATIYRNDTTEGDGEIWTAENYGQINPQITDAMGMYAWDVPRGNYRVVFEKEGYETASTDWLPVPPPQLDINVSLSKISPAELKNAYAHRDEVIVEFDTYMSVPSITTDNLYVESQGVRIDAAIEPLNHIEDSSNPVIGSKFRIIPDKPFVSDFVSLMVKPGSETYAGVKTKSEISRMLPIEDVINDLIAPASFNVAYGKNGELRVQALPADAAAGKSLKVTSSSNIIIGVSDEEIEFDEDGYAIVDINGLLPGTAALTFAINGLENKVTTRVIVSTNSSDIVKAPIASITSGSYVSAGTMLYLSCDTPGAVIYYTLDGSCPCDPTSSREVFSDSQPIMLSKNVTVKAMALIGSTESEIVIFDYRVGSIISGIGVTSNNEIKVYPVPVRDLLNIDTPWSGESMVTISNSLGSVVVKKTIRGSENVIDLSALAPGVYFMTLSGEETITSTIVKE